MRALSGLSAACYNLTMSLTVTEMLTRLSTKGQVVLPKTIRTARGLKPGAQFVVQERDDEIVLKPKSTRPSGNWESLLGCVGYRGPRKSLKEMRDAIAAAAKQRR